MNYIIKCITKKYTVFEGRTNRKEYITFASLYLLVIIASRYFATTIATSVEQYNSLLLIHGIFLLFLFIINSAITCRRLHDLNLSGWWQIIFIIASIFISKIISVIVFIILLFLKGTSGTNKYGKPPID